MVDPVLLLEDLNVRLVPVCGMRWQGSRISPEWMEENVVKQLIDFQTSPRNERSECCQEHCASHFEVNIVLT